MVVGVQRPIGEEQLRQTHLIGDEEFSAIESSEEPLSQARVTFVAKDDRAPLLVIRAVAIQILNARSFIRGYLGIRHMRYVSVCTPSAARYENVAS
jgi:hypothetical protein